MELSPLTAVSPLDGRYGDKTKQLRSIVSEYGLVFYRLQIEILWLMSLCDNTSISDIQPLTQAERTFLNTILKSFTENDAKHIKKIEAKINHDVKAIEYFLREKLKNHQTLKRLSALIHFGCTSEDINNLAYALMIQNTRNTILLPELQKMIRTLDQFAKTLSTLPMLSRTHGQAATPTTLGKEFKNVAVRLKTHVDYFAAIPIAGKCNGAVGNFNAHVVVYPTVDWLAHSKKFVESLNLQWNAHTTQIEPHDFLAQFFNALSVCHTILIDCSRNIWSYISLHYFSQKKSEQEVGSSTMPHKINPIDFENAEGNLGLAITLATYLAQKLPISRFQRDLTDSTVMRNCGSVFGYALISYQSLLNGLNTLIPNPDILKNELKEHWEVLAEPIQMMMRRYHITDAYEQLKKCSRGEKMTKEMIMELINSLTIPEKAKKQLRSLTPDNYLGLASALAKKN